MIKTEHIVFRATQEDRATLERIQRVYQLPSLSEAARRCVRAVANERGLMPVVNEPAGEESRGEV